MDIIFYSHTHVLEQVSDFAPVQPSQITVTSYTQKKHFDLRDGPFYFSWGGGGGQFHSVARENFLLVHVNRGKLVHNPG